MTFGNVTASAVPDGRTVMSTASTRSQERRRREHAAVRGRILAAAVALAHEEGWPNVTLRQIADRIEYTHPAIYRYFATKKELLRALVRHGLQLFTADLEAARASALNPRAALFALAAAHWAFAWHYPELYQVMHGLGGVAFCSANTLEDGRRAGAPAIASVEALLTHEDIEPHEVERKVVLLWSTIHGLITLTMAGRFSQAEGEALALQAVRDALVAWGVPS
jgi:AcrR family transcriptional regulator